MYTDRDGQPASRRRWPRRAHSDRSPESAVDHDGHPNAEANTLRPRSFSDRPLHIRKKVGRARGTTRPEEGRTCGDETTWFPRPDQSLSVRRTWHRRTTGHGLVRIRADPQGRGQHRRPSYLAAGRARGTGLSVCVDALANHLGRHARRSIGRDELIALVERVYGWLQIRSVIGRVRATPELDDRGNDYI